MRLRWGRLAWVLAVNGLAIYFAIYGSSEVRRLRSYLVTPQPLGLSWHDYLRGAIPAAGILFEALGLQIAKYLNIGYFALLTVFWATVCLYNWRDIGAGLYAALFSGFALIASLVYFWLYRKRPALDASTP